MDERAEYRKNKRQAQAAKLRRDNAVRAMLQHSDTREYLMWLLEIGKVGMQPFTTNALTTSFNCGELNVGQQIFDHILEVDTAGYVQMMKERENERPVADTDDAEA